MSNAINSTHQQDRAAQQKLINARQQASAQGQQQGVAFSRMLSLACDEDTSLDALQLEGKLFSLKTTDSDGETGSTAATTRKTGKASKGLSDGSVESAADAPSDGMHPAAQANATLMALLAQAQSANTPSDAPTQPVTADLQAPVGVAEQTSASANAIAAETLVAGTAADTELGKTAATGQAVRELARQLGAAMRQGRPGQDSAPQTDGNGVAWGRQPTVDAGAVSATAMTVGLDTAAGAAGAAGVWDASGPSAAHVVHNAAQAGAGAANENGDAPAEGGDAGAAPLAKTDLRAAGGDGQPQAGLGGEALGGSDMTERSANPEEVVSHAEQWREQWAEAMDEMGQQVSYWVSQGGVRQATLRVGNGWQQAMDVKLSMKNGQAEIEFLTDHEAARSAIAEGGTEVLRDLLAQSGIDLGQVSIGAQTTGGDGDHPQRPADHTRLTPRNDQAPTAPAAVMQPRHAHSSGLDLYV